MNDPDLFNLVRSHSQLLEAIEYMAEQLEVNINKVMFNHISLNDRMLKKIEDKHSRIEVEAERSLSEHIDSGCRFPVGAYASVKSDSLILKVGVYSMDGKKSILIEENGAIDNPFELGKKIGNELKSQGVSEIASNWREKLEEWNKQ